MVVNVHGRIYNDTLHGNILVQRLDQDEPGQAAAAVPAARLKIPVKIHILVYQRPGAENNPH